MCRDVLYLGGEYAPWSGDKVDHPIEAEKIIRNMQLMIFIGHIGLVIFFDIFCLKKE